MHRRRFLGHAWTLIWGVVLGWRAPVSAFAGESSKTEGHGPVQTPKIAIIIDDIGYSRQKAQHFLDLKLPITFSILPQLAKSPALTRIIKGKGHEIMLHQPMEPFNQRLDPGPGAVFVGDPARRIAHTMEENLAANDSAVGVNNHMGSRFTSCSAKISTALEVIKSRGLYFVDSMTTRRSVALQTASRMGMPAGYNRFFLDPVVRETLIYHRLFQLENTARRTGGAIGIGHPHRATARALARFASARNPQRLHWTYVSEVIDPAGAESPDTSKPHADWFYKTAI